MEFQGGTLRELAGDCIVMRASSSSSSRFMECFGYSRELLPFNLANSRDVGEPNDGVQCSKWTSNLHLLIGYISRLSYCDVDFSHG